jgi:hypothetical protein
VDYDGWRLTVDAVDRRRIASVRLTRVDKHDNDLHDNDKHDKHDRHDGDRRDVVVDANGSTKRGNASDGGEST